ncbi:unnamed protein product [Polarella glacialis]|uniref:Uncharacterized protein n=1 Tax=Polarella glacialis TaxID=89957 RepID=A0A813EQF5_POLGL|nr:unnamed protein product [Polarella glacialis]
MARLLLLLQALAIYGKEQLSEEGVCQRALADLAEWRAPEGKVVCNVTDPEALLAELAGGDLIEGNGTLAESLDTSHGGNNNNNNNDNNNNNNLDTVWSCACRLPLGHLALRVGPSGANTAEESQLSLSPVLLRWAREARALLRRRALGSLRPPLSDNDNNNNNNNNDNNDNNNNNGFLDLWRRLLPYSTLLEESCPVAALLLRRLGLPPEVEERPVLV